MKFLYAVFILLLLAGCEEKATITEESISQASDSKTAVNPNLFSLSDIQGNAYPMEKKEKGVAIEGYEGKVVLLNFFATWCPPCRAEIPHLINLQERYQEDFAILAVLMEQDKDNKDLQEFSDSFGVTYPILNGSENYRLADALGGVRSLPTMIMYDRQGNYFTHYLGAVPEEMIEADIKRAMEKTVDKTAAPTS